MYFHMVLVDLNLRSTLRYVFCLDAIVYALDYQKNTNILKYSIRNRNTFY
jgi:hypothetical protein